MAEPYKSPRRAGPRAKTADAPGTPAQARELRAQGRKTMRRLLDAGMRVFAERGFHAARVDDVVRAARTSHGTFYLYFSNKEDLFRVLAQRCVDAMAALAAEFPTVDDGPDGRAALRSWIQRFVATYREHGPVIRAWPEA